VRSIEREDISTGSRRVPELGRGPI